MNIFNDIYNSIIQEAHQNPLDPTGKDVLKGQKAEDNFATIAQSNGYSWKIASIDEERIQHFDGIITSKSGKQSKVEVKSFKGDGALIEFRGIHNHRGWIYGSADFIAYEMYKPYYHFLMFIKPELLKYVENKCQVKWEGNKFIFDTNNLVRNTDESFAPALYIRKEDQSIITRINFNELMKVVPHVTMSLK